MINWSYYLKKDRYKSNVYKSIKKHKKKKKKKPGEKFLNIPRVRSL